jgi:hypothetical protein
LDLLLPDLGQLYLSYNPALIDGWLFWSADRRDRAFANWSFGEPQSVRALHPGDGRQLAWDLPDLSEDERALRSCLATLREDVWLRGDDVVGLAAWPLLEEGSAGGAWTFGVARPVAQGDEDVPATWRFESVAVSGPRVRAEPRFIGTLAPGLALYRVYGDEHTPERWIAVR